MINIKELTFGYNRSRILFNELETIFKKGKIYGLLGRNGAGKTTLLKIISGLLYPFNGTVNIDSYSAFRREPGYLSKIYLLPEEFFLPKMKIQKFVNIYKEFYPNFDENQLNEYLREFDLPLQNFLSQMSYGQKKKFLISFALASNVPVILMDEPTNGMDIPSKTLFRKIVAKSMDENRTIIISTHQVRDVEGMIDYVKIVDNGKIIFDVDYNLIQEKLTVTRTEELPDNALFAAEILGGYMSLVPTNNGMSRNNVDLELLFNSVITNPQKINETLKN